MSKYQVVILWNAGIRSSSFVLTFSWTRIALLVLFFLLINIPPFQSQELQFSNPLIINHRDGLPGARITSCTKDLDGFMWFGTEKGLYRFDGFLFKRYVAIPGDSTSLTNNFVTAVLFDSVNNKLWIGTKKGLNILDLDLEVITQHYHDPDDPQSIPSPDVINTLFRDIDGNIWIGFRLGLSRYNRELGNFQKFFFQEKTRIKGELESFNPKIGSIKAIDQHASCDSILWLGTGFGLLKFNKYKNTFQHYHYQSGNRLLDIGRNAIVKIAVVNNEKIYLGSYNRGLLVFDIQKQSFEHIRLSNNKNLLSNEKENRYNIVKSMLLNDKNNLLVSTEHGLVEIDTHDDSISWEKANEFRNGKYYGANYIDDKDRCWHFRPQGIYCFDPMNEQFVNYPITIPGSETWSSQKIVSHSSGQSLYVSISGGNGLYQVNRKTKEWTEIRPFDRNTYKSGFRGRGLTWLNDNRLLIVEEKKLYTLSEDHKNLIDFPIQPNLKDARYMSSIQDVYGDIWIGTMHAGLIRINIHKHSVKTYYEELGGIKDSKRIELVNLYEDRNHNIWIQSSIGLSVYDRTRDTIFNFKFNSGKEEIKYTVGRFAETEAGDLIVGSTSIYDKIIGVVDPDNPEKGIIRRISINDDSHLITAALTRDFSGNLWFLDNQKLKKLTFPELKITSLDGYDGIAYYGVDPSMVHFNDLDLLPTGEMALSYGKGNGIGLFNPDRIRRNQEMAHPYLVSFNVNGNRYSSDTTLIKLNSITLPFNDNHFTFKYSSVGMTQSFKNEFKYKLENYDFDWTYTGRERRYVSYAGLREGTYILKIAASNNDQIWNENAHQLKIIILPPWYRSKLAYLMYILSFLSLVFTIYYFLRRRWKLKMALILEQQEASRLKEIDTFKTKLYTNLTHEFRTPLTIILGISEQIKNPNLKTLIKRNSQNLLNLINQMLDLQKLEVGSIELNMKCGNIIAYLKHILESFRSLAESKNITLNLVSGEEKIMMDFDPHRITQIISNLLANAIKFTPEQGKIYVHVGMKKITEQNSQHYKNFLEIKVRDTGIGIPQEKLNQVFERFYQISSTSEGKVEGAGIGLALTKELVQVMNGAISVESNPGQGAEFNVVLPITRLKPLLEFNEHYDFEKTKVFVPNSEQIKWPEAENQIISDVDKNVVLVIDDHSEILLYLVGILKKSYKVITAKNGLEGINLAIDKVPDIIISDVMMPGKDGYELTEILKQDLRTSHIPIILLTAKADAASRLEGIRRRADVYLTKPFEKEELLLSMKNLLELRQRLREYYLVPVTGRKTLIENLDNSTDFLLFENTHLENNFVQKVKDIIEKNICSHTLDVSYISKNLAVSHSQLYRKLKALTGMSTNRFIRCVRLQKASELLLDTENTVSNIAYSTGFSDPDYFSRLFKKEYEVTPSQFRNVSKKGSFKNSQ